MILSNGLSYDSTFHVSGISQSVSTRDILQALTAGNESEDEVIRQLKFEIIWVDDSSFFVGTRMGNDIISADDSSSIGLIASHVRNKLHGGLGKVDIATLGEHLMNKHHAAEPRETGGIMESIASVASKPFQALGKLLGFHEKPSICGDHDVSKRIRLS